MQGLSSVAALATSPHDDWFNDPANASDPIEIRSWLTSGIGGVWLDETPITRWKSTSPAFTTYAKNVLKRAQARVAGVNLLDPHLEGLTPIAANGGMNPGPDGEHEDITLLTDVALAGLGAISDQAFLLAMTILEGWVINVGNGPHSLVTVDQKTGVTKYSGGQGEYFRTGGGGPYSTNGRNRNVGAIKRGLKAALRLLDAKGKPEPWWSMILAFITKHVELEETHFPLIDAPKGDHLPDVPHIPAFNAGVNAAADFTLNDVLEETTGNRLAILDKQALALCAIIDHAFRTDPAGSFFVYDIPFDGNVPMDPYTPHVQALQDEKDAKGKWKRRQYDAAGTHVWCHFALARRESLTGTVSAAAEWQRDRAVAAGWTGAAHPWQLVRWFPEFVF